MLSLQHDCLFEPHAERCAAALAGAMRQCMLTQMLCSHSTSLCMFTCWLAVRIAGGFVAITSSLASINSLVLRISLITAGSKSYRLAVCMPGGSMAITGDLAAEGLLALSLLPGDSAAGGCALGTAPQLVDGDAATTG